MLVRKLVRERLARYYAQPADAVVGTAQQWSSNNGDCRGELEASMSLPFSSLWGGWHWKVLYQRLYEKQKGQWLTPVELFRPYYSNSIARFIAKHSSSEVTNLSPLATRLVPSVHIVEVGGGRGTNAVIVLDYLQRRHPNLYDRCRYTLVDSSPTLLDLQRDVIRRSPHEEKVNLRHLDLMDVAEGRESLLPFPSSSVDHCPDHTVLLALEVFDNLAHDKIRRRSRGTDAAPGDMLEQAEVRDVDYDRGLFQTDDDSSTYSPSLKETFHPLSDPLLRRILDVAPWYAPASQSHPHPPNSPVWIPSVACGTLLQLADHYRRYLRLNHRVSILVADFDWLPPPDRFDPAASYATKKWTRRVKGDNKASPYRYIPGIGEPLVTSMDGFDHECYLNSPELSDILFPTHFDKLAAFGRAVFSRPATNGKTPTGTSEGTSSPVSSSCDVRVYKQSEFLLQYDADGELDRTKSWLTGYSPLVDDFANCSVLTIACKG